MKSPSVAALDLLKRKHTYTHTHIQGRWGCPGTCTDALFKRNCPLAYITDNMDTFLGRALISQGKTRADAEWAQISGRLEPFSADPTLNVQHPDRPADVRLSLLLLFFFLFFFFFHFASALHRNSLSNKMNERYILHYAISIRWCSS